MNSKKTTILFLLLSIPVMSGWSQEEYCSMALSNSEIEGIGYIQDSDENWRPLFFDIDDSGNIHIPDFYKGRIAVFNKRGEYVTEYPAGEYISPRMNYFALARKDTDAPLWITYSDFTLSLFSQTRQILRKEFPIGTIPDKIILADQFLFVHIPGSGKNLIFGPVKLSDSTNKYQTVSATPIGSYGKEVEDSFVPVIRIKGYDLPLDMQYLPEVSPQLDSTEIAEDAGYIFSSILEEGGTAVKALWLRYSAGTAGGPADFAITDLDTGEVNKKTILFPKDGFWTVINGNRIFRNVFTREMIIILSYSISP